MNSIIRRGIVIRRSVLAAMASSGGGGGSSTLLGVGSASTSLIDYPKTGEVTSADWYVDPTSPTNGAGTVGDPFNNLDSAITAAAAGDVIGIFGGTLTKTSRYTVAKENLTITGLNGQRPLIDRTGGSNTTGFNTFAFSITASGVHLNNLEVIGVPKRTDSVVHRGISLQGNNCLIEDIWMHDSEGGSFYNDGGDNNIFQDCVSYKIGDGSSTDTNTPDAYVSTNTGNNTGFVRCFSANAPDDAFDVFTGGGHFFIDCVAYKPGRYWNGNTAGDGGGFKMGGGSSLASNSIRGSIVVQARGQGIVHNSSPRPNFYYNCTAVGCGSYGIRQDNVVGTLVYEVISLGNNTNYLLGASNPTYRNNTWNLGITSAGFADPTLFDWSLAVGSACIGAGFGGINLGASDVALEILKYWAAQPLT